MQGAKSLFWKKTKSGKWAARAAIRLFFVAVFSLALTLTGCQTTAQTTEPLLKSMAIYSCDAIQGFSSGLVDTNAVKSEISDLEKQIKSFQQDIESRQNEITTLKEAAKSEEQQQLEQEVAVLQEQISSLQSKLKESRRELLLLQNSQSSEEITKLRKEISNLEMQVSTLQNTMNRLKSDLNTFYVKNQIMVGYIEHVKIGGTELVGDITVADPVSSSRSSVVGVLANISWDGGVEDPIMLTSQISEQNKLLLDSLMLSSLLNSDVELSFTVYNFDSDARESFKCFHTNSGILHGGIYKPGKEYFMQIDSDPWTVPSISKSYSFSLGVVPKPQLQTIYKANSVKEQLVQQWGMTAVR